jgi:hypothetical protein
MAPPGSEMLLGQITGLVAADVNGPMGDTDVVA